jgi:hypothetical protein
MLADSFMQDWVNYYNDSFFFYLLARFIKANVKKKKKVMHASTHSLNNTHQNKRQKPYEGRERKKNRRNYARKITFQTKKEKKNKYYF